MEGQISDTSQSHDRFRITTKNQSEVINKSDGIGMENKPINSSLQLMIQFIVTVCVLLNATWSIAQSVGINDTGASPNSKAILDIQSTSKGLLIPRMTTTERLGLSLGTSEIGMIVFDSTLGVFYFWTGASWTALGADNLGNHMATQSLRLNGNALSNNGGSGLIISDVGEVGIGTNSPEEILHVVGDGRFDGSLLAVSGDFSGRITTNSLTIEDDFEVGGYSFPSSDGSMGQLLTTNGNGLLSWTSLSALESQTLSISADSLSISRGNSVDLSAYLDADNLGNHIATQSLRLNNNSITNNGGTGLKVSDAGNVGIRVDASNTHVLLMRRAAATTAIGITQQLVGDDHSMEFTTADSSSTQATRLLLNGGSDQSDIVFFRGARGAETSIMYLEGSNGNVGIGTGTPSYKLDVTGTGRFTDALTVGAYTFPNTDGASNQILSTDGSGNLSWRSLSDLEGQTLTLSSNTLSISGGNSVDLSAYLDADNLGNHIATQNIRLNNQMLVNNGSTGLSLDNSGNVGIRVSPSSTHVLLMRRAAATTAIGITQQLVGDDHSMEFTTADGSSTQASRLLLNGGSDQSDIVFFRGARGAETSIMYLEGSNGNVGIGTGTPSYKLDVTGTGRFTDALTVGAYTFPNTDGTSNQILNTDGSGNLSWTDLSAIESQTLALNANMLSISGGNSVDLSAYLDADHLGNHIATQNIQLNGNNISNNGGNGISISDAGHVYIGNGANQWPFTLNTTQDVFSNPDTVDVSKYTYAITSSTGTNGTGVGIGFGSSGGGGAQLGAGIVFKKTNINSIGDLMLMVKRTNVSYGDHVPALTVKGLSRKIGIGTTSPLTELDVAGTIRMDDGNQQAGHLIVSDAQGRMSWTSPNLIKDNLGDHIANQSIQLNGNNISNNGGNGISISDAGHVYIGNGANQWPFTLNTTQDVFSNPDTVDTSKYTYAITSSAGTNGTGVGIGFGSSGGGGAQLGAGIVFKKTSINSTGDLMLMVKKNAASFSEHIPALTVKGINGRVGIGTTSPQKKLDVVGNGRFTGVLTVGAYTLPNTDGTTGQLLTTNGSGVLSWTNPAIESQTLSLSTDSLSISGGNSVDLSVYAKDEQMLSISSDSLRISGGNSVDLSGYLDADNLGNHLANQNIRLNGNWLCNDGGFEGIKILNNGRVTIQTGATGPNGFITTIRNTDTGTGYTNGLLIQAGENTQTVNNRFISFRRPDGTEIGAVRQVTSSSVDFWSPSDKRLKHHLKVSSYGLNELLKIHVQDYYYLDDRINLQTGFIAQQLYQHFPNAVSVGGENPKTDPWMVNYGRLTPIIVQAIQDQQKEIEQYNSKIEVLEIEIQKLKRDQQELNDLKAEMAEIKRLLLDSKNVLPIKTERSN